MLLHPGLWDARIWDLQFEAFAASHDVVRYDLRGYGRSDVPSLPYSDVRDLRYLIGALGIERCALVGCQVGGQLAIDAALAHPDAVEALVLVAPGLSGYAWRDPGLEVLVEEVGRAVAAGDLEGAMELELAVWAPLRSGPEIDAWVRGIADGQPPPCGSPARSPRSPTPISSSWSADPRPSTRSCSTSSPSACEDVAVERTLLVIGAISGLLGVGAGAFGAHALRSRLSAEQLVWFETAVRYQLWHALGLFAAVLVGSVDVARPGAERTELAAVRPDVVLAGTIGWPAAAAGWLFVAGTVLFSGSLYALALTGRRRWASVAPVGGACFLLGWAALVLAAATV